MEERRVFAALVVVSIALATVMAAVASINLAVPAIALDTRANQTTITWIVDAYALTFALLLLPGGALGDHFGRRRVLAIGLVVFGTASLGMCLASGADQLVLCRVIMGVGAALVMPATLATITATFPPERRNVGVTVWVTVTIAASVLGLIATGIVLEYASYRWTFVLNVVLAGVALVGTSLFVPESREAKTRRIDVIGALLSITGLGPIVYAIIEAPENGWLSVPTAVGVVGGSVLLIAFFVWESRVTDPLLDPRVFRNAAFTAGTVSLTFQFTIFFGFVFVLMQSFQLVSGYSALQAGLAIAPAAFGAVPGAKLSMALSRRMRADLIAPLGLGCITLGMVGLALLSADQPYVLTAAALSMAGLGLGIATIVGTTAITDALPADEQGVASAVNDLAREVGATLGLAVLGSVLTSAYRSNLDLPVGADADRARDSFAIATTMPADIAAAGQAAFVTATHISFATAAGIGVMAIVIVLGISWAGARAETPARGEAPLPHGATRVEDGDHPAAQVDDTAPVGDDTASLAGSA